MPLCPLELYALAMLKADGFYMHDIVLSLCFKHATLSHNALLPPPLPPPWFLRTFSASSQPPKSLCRTLPFTGPSEQVKLTQASGEWLSLGDWGGGRLATGRGQEWGFRVLVIS